MKKQKTVPTLLAIFLLVAGIVAGVFLIQSDKVFLTNASPELAPKQVRITNITDKGFSVVWSTDKEAQGFISYGDSKSLGLTMPQQGNLPKSSTLVHHTTIDHLKPNTTYYFKVGVDSELFDNNGDLFQVRTGPEINITPEPDIIFGRVLNSSNQPITDAVVVVTIQGMPPQSAITDISGKWSVPLSTARNNLLNSYATYDLESLIDITTQALGSSSTTKVKVKNAHPVPAIVLGKNQDFTNEKLIPNGTVPNAEIKLN